MCILVFDDFKITVPQYVNYAVFYYLHKVSCVLLYGSEDYMNVVQSNTSAYGLMKFANIFHFYVFFVGIVLIMDQ